MLSLLSLSCVGENSGCPVEYIIKKCGCWLNKQDSATTTVVEDAILLGLVISSDTFTKNDSSYLEFIHLSVQEILAMAHLLTMDEDQIKDALEKMWKSPLFSGSALQHLFGLCYDSHDNIEELMGRVGKKAVKSTTLKKHLYAIIHVRPQFL